MDKEQIYHNLEKIDVKEVKIEYDEFRDKNLVAIPYTEDAIIVFDPNLFIHERELSSDRAMYDLAYSLVKEYSEEQQLCLFPDYANSEKTIKELRSSAYKIGKKIIGAIGKNIATDILNTYDWVNLEYDDSVAIMRIYKNNDVYIINDVFGIVDYDKVKFEEIAPHLFIAINQEFSVNYYI